MERKDVWQHGHQQIKIIKIVGRDADDDDNVIVAAAWEMEAAIDSTARVTEELSSPPKATARMESIID